MSAGIYNVENERFPLSRLPVAGRGMTF